MLRNILTSLIIGLSITVLLLFVLYSSIIKKTISSYILALPKKTDRIDSKTNKLVCSDTIKTCDCTTNQSNVNGTKVPDWSVIKNTDAFWLSNNQKMALDPKVIDVLARSKKSLTKSSIIHNIYQGKISILDFEEKKAFYETYNAKLTIRIANKEDEDEYTTFYLSEDDLSKAEFFMLNGDSEAKIKAADLKVGDEVTIDHTFDAMKNIPLPTPKEGYDYLTSSWGINTVKLVITKVK